MDWEQISPLILQYENAVAKLPELTNIQKSVMRAIEFDKKRFVILRWGRRTGKTLFARHLIVSKAAETRGIYLWLLPTYTAAENIAFRALQDVAQPNWDVSVGRLRITLPNGSIIYVAGADHYDSFRGYKLDGVILDEFSQMDAGRVWTEICRPALMDNPYSWALICSTPNGLDHFWRLEQDALDNPLWVVFHYTSYDNPFIQHSEIEQLKKDLDEQTFRQEILADHIKADGQVFRGLDKVCVIEQPDLPENHKGHTLVMGIDFAAIRDFTVCTVICSDCGKVVDWSRFNQLDFGTQREIIVSLAHKWNVWSILAEANSIGMPNIEALLYENDMPIEAFQTTAQSKNPLIRGLVKVLEDKKLLVPKEYFGELSGFQAKQDSMTGFIRYGGVSGIHDDRVISLALAWKHASQNQGNNILVV